MLEYYLTKIFEFFPLVIAGAGIIGSLAFWIAYFCGRTELNDKVYKHWEKKEKREAKRKAKAEYRARRDFWNGKRPRQRC